MIFTLLRLIDSERDEEQQRERDTDKSKLKKADSVPNKGINSL